MNTTYPGAGRVASEQFDLYYLKHGWLSRHAAYQSGDDMAAVARWYAALTPEAEIHEAGGCVTLRQSRVIAYLQRSLYVLLCRLPPGTRIVVDETLFLGW